MRAPFFVFDDGGAIVAYPDLERLEEDLATLRDLDCLEFWDADGQRLRWVQASSGQTLDPFEPPLFDMEQLCTRLVEMLATWDPGARSGLNTDEVISRSAAWFEVRRPKTRRQLFGDNIAGWLLAELFNPTNWAR